jgi:hypothetical protein
MSQVLPQITGAFVTGDITRQGVTLETSISSAFDVETQLTRMFVRGSFNKLEGVDLVEMRMIHLGVIGLVRDLRSLRQQPSYRIRKRRSWWLLFLRERDSR